MERGRIQADGVGDAPTIQAGIDRSTAGDTVLALPRRFVENLDFKGKAIVVMGSGPESTTLDGGGKGACVSFVLGEGRASVITGLTITNGGTTRDAGSGGGVRCHNTEPTIRGNVIKNNRAFYGGGVYCGAYPDSKRPVVQDNTLEANEGVVGGGTAIDGTVVAEILNNTIFDNRAVDGMGGGIYLRMSQSGSVVRGNFIHDNAAGNNGGGIHAGGESGLVVEITENVILDDTSWYHSYLGCPCGGGIGVMTCSAWVHHNTLLWNVGGGGGG